MAAHSGDFVVLLPTGATEQDANKDRRYPVFDAYALTYDVAVKRITYTPLLCGECELPVGQWDFQYSRSGRRDGYGICANEHMTTITPSQGCYEVV